MRKLFLIDVRYSDHLVDISFDIRDEQILKETRAFYQVQSKEYGKYIIYKGNDIALIDDVLKNKFKIQYENYYDSSIDVYDHYYTGVFIYDDKYNTVENIEKAKSIIKKATCKTYIKFVKDQIEELTKNLNNVLNI